MSERYTSPPLSAWISEGKGPELNLEDARVAFDAFIRQNFTGPPLTELPPAANASELCARLTVDGELVSSLVELPQLLVAAEAAFRKKGDKLYLARALVVHQSLLAGPSTALHDDIFDNYGTYEVDNKNNDSIDSASIFAEIARAHLVYTEDSEAEKYLHQAKRASGLVFAVTGIAGRKTRYQTHKSSQLVCLAVSASANKSFDNREAPQLVELNSDLLLEAPDLEKITIEGLESLPEALRDVDPAHQPALSDLDCAILLLEEELLRQRNPSTSDPVVTEQLGCLIRRVLANPSPPAWIIAGRALWTRSLLESQSTHTIERGTLQMGSLVEELKLTSLDDTSSAVDARLDQFHSVLPLPKWSMDTQLAEQFMSIGAVMDAVIIYERIRLWSEAALCYAISGREDKAVEVLNEHLAKEPSDAKAWSVKGDITKDPKCWLRAWEVGCYPAAMRALGRYWYSPPVSGVQRDLKKAREALEKSLTANKFNMSAQFLAGVVCLEQEDWDAAAKHFHYCTTIEDDDYKSWTNLGSALLQQDKPEAALNALRQAIRVNRNTTPNWKVWSNYITVAAQIDSWADVIAGLGQMLALKTPPPDFSQMIPVIHEVVFIFLKSGDFSPEDQLQRTMAELVTQKLPRFMPSEPSLWQLIAEVELWRGRPWDALAAREKAFRLCVNISDVSTSSMAFGRATRYCRVLVDSYRTLGPLSGRIEGSTVCPDWPLKAKTAVRSLLNKGHLEQEGTPTWNELEKLKSEI